MEGNPRQVIVPIAGYVVVEVDPEVEPETSTGWDFTDFEDMCQAEANEVLRHLDFEKGKAPVEWTIEAHVALTRGNALFADHNEIVDMGTD